MAEDDKNNRVSTREFYAELMALREDQAVMERRILARIDGITGKFATVREVDELRNKSNRVDALIGTVTVISTLVAAALGIRQQ